MQNIPEFIAGSFNFVWGMAGVLVVAVFGWVLATRPVSRDVRQLMIGVIMAFAATAIYTLYWTAFRFALFQEDIEGAAWFMENAHFAAATMATLGIGAGYLHMHPHLQRVLGRWARPLYFAGAALVWAAYAAGSFLT